MIRSTRIALDHYYETEEIRGPKTSRFAQVLRGDNNVVVVDTWMARVMGVPDKQARAKSTQEWAERTIAWLVPRLSERTGLIWTSAEAQAAVWAGYIKTFYEKGNVPVFRTQHVGVDRKPIPF
jgi:hypothetical protein